MQAESETPPEGFDYAEAKRQAEHVFHHMIDDKLVACAPVDAIRSQILTSVTGAFSTEDVRKAALEAFNQSPSIGFRCGFDAALLAAVETALASLTEETSTGAEER